MSFLQEWLKRHEMTDQDGLVKSRLDPATYYYILKGGRTTPILALMAGHNLGMSASETMMIGVKVDPDSEMAHFYPFAAHRNWFTHVKKFDADAIEKQIYGKRKEKRIMTQDYCAWCGKLVEGKKTGGAYCSDFCCQTARRTAKLKKSYDEGKLSGVLLTCPYCKGLYWARSINTKNHYCSDICEALAKESAPIMRREAGV